MPVNIDQYIAAGVDRAYWGVIANDNYVKGKTGIIANGSDAGLGMLVGVKSADYQIPEPERVNITGNDKRLGTFQFQSVEASAFQVEMGASDFELAAASQGTIIRTRGKWNMNLLRPGTLTLRNIMILLNSQAKSMESGSVGLAGWNIALFPHVELVYLGQRGYTERGEHNFAFAAVVNPYDTFPWGELMTEALDGDVSADGIEFFAENRICMHTHIGNASDANLTLEFTPAGESGNEVMLWQEGVLKTYTTDYSVVASTKVLTFAAAPATGVRSVVLFEHTL